MQYLMINLHLVPEQIFRGLDHIPVLYGHMCDTHLSLVELVQHGRPFWVVLIRVDAVDPVVTPPVAEQRGKVYAKDEQVGAMYETMCQETYCWIGTVVGAYDTQTGLCVKLSDKATGPFVVV